MPDAGATRPRRGIGRDRAAGLVFVALGAAIAWETRRLPLGSLTDPGPGYMPLLLAGLIAALGLVVAAFGRSPALTEIRWPELRHAALILAACAFATVALERLGYRITVAALLVFLLGAVERRPLLAAAAVAVGLAVASHYLFAVLLKVPLPVGPWGI